MPISGDNRLNLPLPGNGSVHVDSRAEYDAAKSTIGAADALPLFTFALQTFAAPTHGSYLETLLKLSADGAPPERILADCPNLAERVIQIAPQTYALWDGVRLYITPTPNSYATARRRLHEGNFGVSEVRELFSTLALNTVTMPRQDRDNENPIKEIRDVIHFELMMREQNREAIEADLGIKLNSISLADQFYILRYLKDCPPEEVLRVRKFLECAGGSAAAAFRVGEYGADRIDHLLDLPNHLTPLVLCRMTQEFSRLVEHSRELVNQIHGFHVMPLLFNVQSQDALDFFTGFREGLVRRAADLIEAAYALRVPEDSQALTPQDAAGALAATSFTVEMLSDFISGSGTSERRNRFSFRELPASSSTRRYAVYDPVSDSEATLKLFVRPHANPEQNAQARINIEIRFDTEFPHLEFQPLFAQTVMHFGQKHGFRESSALRIAIDRDTFDGAAKVSLDVGRAPNHGQRFSRSGDALGKLLSLVASEGSHTTESFAPRLAEPAVFEGIAEAFLFLLSKPGIAMAMPRLSAREVAEGLCHDILPLV